MQHKLFNVLGIILITLAINQCKCASRPMHDTINVDLQWGSSQPIDLAGLDLKTAEGLTCWVPSEKTTYFINEADGKTYQFTQVGKLECQASGNATSFTLGKAFVFAAGSMQQQHLYLGSLQGNNLTIYQLEEGSWKQAIHQNIAASFLGSTLQQDKFIVACTLQLDGQLTGCIMFIHKKAAEFELGCLLFDPAKKTLTKVKIDPSVYSEGSTITKHTYLIGVLGIQPGKLFLGKGDHNNRLRNNAPANDSYDILQIEAKTLRPLSKNLKNNSATVPTKDNAGGKSRWEFFSLVDPSVGPAISIPIFGLILTTLKERAYCLYRLTAQFDFKLLLPPDGNDQSNQPSLVIPFGDKLYWITTRLKPETSEQEEETIYYEAQLVPGKAESNSNQG